MTHSPRQVDPQQSDVAAAERMVTVVGGTLQLEARAMQQANTATRKRWQTRPTLQSCPTQLRALRLQNLLYRRDCTQRVTNSCSCITHWQQLVRCRGRGSGWLRAGGFSEIGGATTAQVLPDQALANLLHGAVQYQHGGRRPQAFAAREG